MNLNLLLENLDDQVIGLEGPTGCGKTLGMLSFIQNHPEKVGNVLMIFPNQHTLSRIKYRIRNKDLPIKLFNANVGLSYFLNNRENINTVIMDEAHFVSKEYETFLQTLKYFERSSAVQLKLYFISATLNHHKMKQNFPSIKFISMESISRFQVSITYDDTDFAYYPMNQLGMSVLDSVNEKIQNCYPVDHSRIIVFLSSHDQCEKYRKFLIKNEKIENCLVLHGNLNDEYYRLTESIIYNPTTSFVLLCTNIIETAVTIPNVSLVLDLCITYQKNGNMLSLEWCDQSSLIQRAGRTGRTCSGQVVRYISKEHYLGLPFHREPTFSWEKSCLVLKSFQLDPIKILGDKVMGSMNILQEKGILDDSFSILNYHLLKFCLESPLEINGSTLLWKIRKQKPCIENILIVLAISLINLMETQNVSFICKKDCKYSTNDLIHTFKEKDELCILLSIFINLFLNPKPLVFAKEFNLNFKTFRIWCRQFENCLQIVMPDCDSWKNTLSNLYQYHSHVAKKREVYFLDGYHHHISHFLYNNTTYPIIQYTFDVRFDIKMIRIPCHMLKFRSILTLITKRLQGIPDPIISLFIFPYHLNFSLDDLEDGIYDYYIFQMKKKIVKSKLNNCLMEIKDEVSYRPGLLNMVQSINDWSFLLNDYNLKIESQI